MKRADRIFAFISLGLSCWLILESFKYDYMTTYTPWLGICLGLLSFALLFSTFGRKDGKQDKEAGHPRTGKKALLRAGLILLITAGLVFFMTKIGFILAAFVFIALNLIVLERFSIIKGILYSTALSGAIFLIFRFWLNVDLPTGWLGL